MGLLSLLLLCMIAPAAASAAPTPELRAIAWHDAPRVRAPAAVLQQGTTTAPSSELREPFGAERPRPSAAPVAHGGALREPFAAPRATTRPPTDPHAPKLPDGTSPGGSGLREPFARH